MASNTCPYCGRFSHVTGRYAEYIQVDAGHRTFTALQAAASCDQCHRLVVGMTLDYAHLSGTALERFRSVADRSITWHPETVGGKDFPDVPNHIAVAANEAHAILSVGASMSAILMARSVVEASAKEVGVRSGSLFDKIDALATAGHIRTSTQEAGHAIRIFGNDMAHGDISEQPTSEEAEEVLALMDEVLNEVFQGPARTARVREKAAARKALTGEN